MTRVLQIIVPDGKLVSRIIFCETLVTELYVIDRSDKDFVAKNEHNLKKPALYILINRDEKKLYVGETDDSFKRLKNHEAKEFWTEAIVFHSTADTLSTTEVKWLEAKTYEELSKMQYYDLTSNKQVPQYPKLKRNQLDTLELIFEEEKNYICAAGFDIFLKGGKSNDAQKSKENPRSEKDPYLCDCKKILSYYSSVRGKFIKEVLKKLGLNDSIFEITDLDVLEMVRKEVAKKEKALGRHKQYACSISQLKHYIENGLSYKEFAHDADLVKNKEKEKKENGK